MHGMLLTNLTTLIFKKSFDTIKWDTYYLPPLPREKDNKPPTTNITATATTTS